MLPGDIGISNVKATRSDLVEIYSDSYRCDDSFVCLEEWNAKIFVRKPVSVEARNLVRVDFCCLTIRADEKVSLIV